MVTSLRRLSPLAQLLLAGLVLRSLLALVLPPGYDEAYYLFYGRHPNLSYLDHPVGVGVWSLIGNGFGGSIQALRLPSLLSSTGALALAARGSKSQYPVSPPGRFPAGSAAQADKPQGVPQCFGRLSGTNLCQVPRKNAKPWVQSTPEDGCPQVGKI